MIKTSESIKINSIKGFVILTYLQLEFLHSLGHPQDLLLQGCLISLEIAELLIKSLGLSLLVAVVPVDLFSYSVELVGQRFSGVLTLHSQNGLEGLLLRSQNLHLFLMHIQILS